MIHLQKIRIACILSWVSLDFARRNHRSSLLVTRSYHIVQSLRSYGRKKTVHSDNGLDFNKDPCTDGENVAQISCVAQEEAQSALLEYLHSTRSLQFTDAEHMSRNSPNFLKKLLERVKNEEKIGQSMDRFLRYHPINEFEPFFESMGFKPSEYSHFLPRNLMFLNDDVMLLENYHVLCNYGIARNRIGKIYKEAAEIFKYDYGVLESKLQCFKEMGLSQSAIIKVVSSCPHLLVGNRNMEFYKVLEKLKIVGIESEWIEGHLVESNSYNWNHMFELLGILSYMGFHKDKLGKLISERWMILFEASGTISLSLIGFLLKFGSNNSEICSMFLDFPEIEVKKFLCNMRECYQVLVDIEMEIQDIGRIVRSHPSLLGSCSLKKLNTLLSTLNSGKKRLCDLVKENPQILKDWVLGLKIKRLPNTGEIIRSRTMRTKFLLNLGFVENSVEIKRAVKLFRGKGEELQERFDYFVKAGLNRKDVVEMIKVAPQILNQRKDVIRKKIDFLVNDLGYPMSTLVSFPAYISYTLQRVKLRFSMYNWLKERGLVESNLSLSTMVTCSDKVFMMRYVNKHPVGPEVFEKLKKEIFSE